MIQPVGGKLMPAEMHVVVNWSEELAAHLTAAGN
jgi:hypothetical protein